MVAANAMSSHQHFQMVMEEMKTKEADEMRVEAGEGGCCEYTLDGSLDIRGRPANKAKTGGWVAGSLILVNQGLATLAYYGVSLNLVLFLTRVMQRGNADVANTISKWTGTVYICSLVGAFLSDSYWGRYKTCAIFQAIFVLGLVMFSLTSYISLLQPSGCGTACKRCGPHSTIEIGIFYASIYMIALGNGGYQPNISTFGADQFDKNDRAEAHSKAYFFSYFFLALNMGSLFSNTFISYFEDKGWWALGFWVSTGSAVTALVVFLCGTHTYRHFKPCGNPITRVFQVIVSASRKWRIPMLPDHDNLFELEDSDLARGIKKMIHTEGFRFLDRAALINSDDEVHNNMSLQHNPWHLCTITQVEEVKSVLRLIPIWLCTIIYSVVYTQKVSLFIEQGAIMNTAVASFHIPPASMSVFDIFSVATFIFLYRRILHPMSCRLRKDGRGLTELERIGIGLFFTVMAMVSAGTVENYRLRRSGGSLSILWQIPQYVLVGASEVFLYVGQLEFFNKEAPEGLKSFGSALCMTSLSLGNYVNSLIVSVVMEVTTKGGRRPGWIPNDLNKGHIDLFYFLLAALTSLDFVVYVLCARWYRRIKPGE